jgi:hypothetical protein
MTYCVYPRRRGYMYLCEEDIVRFPGRGYNCAFLRREYSVLTWEDILLILSGVYFCEVVIVSLSEKKLSVFLWIEYSLCISEKRIWCVYLKRWQTEYISEKEHIVFICGGLIVFNWELDIMGISV